MCVRVCACVLRNKFNYQESNKLNVLINIHNIFYEESLYKGFRLSMHTHTQTYIWCGASLGSNVGGLGARARVLVLRECMECARGLACLPDL